jgi:hypothetical protein
MTTASPCFFSLLQYCDLKREENLVIGVLLIFPGDQIVRFLHPERLDRLQVAFPNAPLKTIRAYFEGFKMRTLKVVEQKMAFPQSPLEAKIFIAENFLTEDSSALQFSEPRTVAPMLVNEERIARNFYERFLQTYEIPVETILA